MSSVFGILGVLLLVYWLYAINRPVHDRPLIVRGAGLIAIPIVAVIFLYLAGG